MAVYAAPSCRGGSRGAGKGGSEELGAVAGEVSVERRRKLGYGELYIQKRLRVFTAQIKNDSLTLRLKLSYYYESGM